MFGMQRLIYSGVNVLVKTCMAVGAMCKIKQAARGRDAMQQSTRRSRDALLATKQRVKSFISCIARARPCFNCFKELTHECLAIVKAYPFQSITHPATSSSRVRRFWAIFYANASVSRRILAELINLDSYAILFYF